MQRSVSRVRALLRSMVRQARRTARVPREIIPARRRALGRRARILLTAVAFATSGQQTGTGSSLSITVTVNQGSTALVAAVLDSVAGSAVTTIAGGGAYRRLDTQQNGQLYVEMWTTEPGMAQAASGAGAVVVSYSGTVVDAGAMVVTYVGVGSIGPTSKSTGAGANPSNAQATQEPNNIIVTAFGWLNILGTTAGTGSLRISDGNSAISDAIVDNTSTTPASVTTSVTHGAGTWALISVELRTAPAFTPDYTSFPMPPFVEASTT